ncbi:MAG: efflux RND transporter periplasmic adaptor subunit [Bacteroidota bacterium]|nr:efflux RND transporter periplasmic adaptor subunit [Bacteroidota bacterium]
MKSIKLFLIILICILISSCSDKSPETNEVKEEQHDEEKEQGSEVALTGEQLKLMGIELSKIEDHNISGYIRASGEVKINPDQESKVGGIIPGRINRINVKEGSFVRAGQILATLENVDLVSIQTDYVSARNEYQFAKQEFERQRRLSESNIGSKKTLAELEAQSKRSLTNLKALEQKLASYRISKDRFDDDTIINVQRYFSITAPISGNVVSRMVAVGQFVDPSVDMFYIVNTSTVFVDLNIFEQDLGKVLIGQKVNIENSSYPGESFVGKISSINKVFDDASRTVRVRVLINNKEGRLLPNMFVTAKIYVQEGGVLSVPKSAIEEIDEEKFIYVKTDERTHIDEHKHDEHEEKKNIGKPDEHEGEHKDDHAGEGAHEDEHEPEGIVFKRIVVKTGIEDDTYVEIIPMEPIGENAEVVSTGTFYLKSEMMKGELGEHDH